MTKATKVKTEEYKASIKLHGVWFKAEGETVLEAITNLKPNHSKTVGVLVVEKGKKKREKVLGKPLVAQLFGPGSAMRKEIGIKNVSLMFDL